GITQVQEIDAFNHSPIHNIQTGYDPFSQHSYISPAAFSASLSVILPSYRAMPTTTPATAPLSRSCSISATLLTPPDAITASPVARPSATVASIFTPVSKPSRLTSVNRAWRTPTAAIAFPSASGVVFVTCCQPCVVM